MSKKELEDKLKRKNLQIESQIALLDEYRNTIKFLEAKIFRMEQELSKLHQPTVSNSSLICERCQGTKVVLIGSQDTRPCPYCC